MAPGWFPCKSLRNAHPTIVYQPLDLSTRMACHSLQKCSTISRENAIPMFCTRLPAIVSHAKNPRWPAFACLATAIRSLYCVGAPFAAKPSVFTLTCCSNNASNPNDDKVLHLAFYRSSAIVIDRQFPNELPPYQLGMPPLRCSMVAPAVCCFKHLPLGENGTHASSFSA